MRKLIVANWKMNKTIGEARQFCHELLPRIEGYNGVDIAICPPFTCLESVSNLLSNSKVALGAQNLFWKEKGDYTGEISPTMLVDVGCKYVIVGHSERRHILGETDLIVNRKLKAALEAGLIPILCVGETLQERENNRAKEVIKDQLMASLEDVNLNAPNIVIAYEPVWAIGTGVNASSEDAQEMCLYIRNKLNELYGEELASNIPILYGGSVKENNLADFLNEKDVDGALVGGASLDAQSFAELIRIGADGK
ncbi:MAG: triose-phosphate isomerase [Syntrophomonadaceae bacterium]|nr:triose-phosphate isomerase [Syntrophomonadaceae bacterium]